MEKKIKNILNELYINCHTMSKIKIEYKLREVLKLLDKRN